MVRFVLLGLCLICPRTLAWELAGEHEIRLHDQAGGSVSIGTLRVDAGKNPHPFELSIETARFKDFFLSMREFKCLETPEEVFCRVPYPHDNPMTLARDNLAWLEHALLFFYKRPGEFGANLWNGIYYQLEVTDAGLVGTPRAVDLNQISAPPEDPSVPPFADWMRSEIDPEDRAFFKLTIQ